MGFVKFLLYFWVGIIFFMLMSKTEVGMLLFFALLIWFFWLRKTPVSTLLTRGAILVVLVKIWNRLK